MQPASRTRMYLLVPSLTTNPAVDTSYDKPYCYHGEVILKLKRTTKYPVN